MVIVLNIMSGDFPTTIKSLMPSQNAEIVYTYPRETTVTNSDPHQFSPFSKLDISSFKGNNLLSQGANSFL